MKACIIGSTGYAGQQLASLLLKHPKITHLFLGSFGSANEPMAERYRHLSHIIPCQLMQSELLLAPQFLKEQGIDILFFALPHSVSSQWIGKIMGYNLPIKIIDLGADFRIKDLKTYTQWYGDHPHPSLLPKATYGLTELNPEGIKNSTLIANPGCYATATLLAAHPAVEAEIIGHTPLIVDAKSGISGAGRQGNVDNLFAEISENMRPYHVGEHRHIPEIEQSLGCSILFSPSVVPMSRGMISAVYSPLSKKCSLTYVKRLYQDAYRNSHYIRFVETPPITKAVRGSNFADIWLHIDERTQTFVSMVAIDNLMKGASGQAVQNMNLMMGFDETLGLEQVPLYP